jgi:hypothetical protein
VSDLQSIHIDSGVKRIAINDDPNRIIEFNPHDTLFAEKLYRAYTKLAGLEKSYNERAAELDKSTPVDDLNVPTDFTAFIELEKEMVADVLGEIDYLFGEGACERIFGDEVTIPRINQFIEGVMQYITPERAEKMSQYMPKRESGSALKNVVPPELLLTIADEYRGGTPVPTLARKYQIKEAAIKAVLEKMKAG